jgi:hypothetical protein
MKKQLFLSLFCLFSYLLSNDSKEIQKKFEKLHALGLTVKRYQNQKWDKQEQNCIKNKFKNLAFQEMMKPISIEKSKISGMISYFEEVINHLSILIQVFLKI